MPTETIALTTLFTTATEPPTTDHHDAVELVLILLADPLAWPDLVRTLFAGNPVDVTTRAGLNRILQILYAFGIIEDVRAENGQILRLRFRAEPLLQMLRNMPNRDAQTGLVKSITEKITH